MSNPNSFSLDVSEPKHQDARAAFRSFAEAHPDNVYESDEQLRRVLPLYVKEGRLDELQHDLEAFGAVVAGPMDALAIENNREHNLPRLQRYDGFGARVETIEHHPAYHEIGRHVYRSGMLSCLAEPDDMVGALARHAVSSYAGEAGHNCPVACSAGVIRALQHLGNDELKGRYLPRLLTRDYDRHVEGAQFLSEIQGGSDVGANATRAEQADDGTWRIRGEKWFATNIDADVFLMTARIEGQGDGTRGLGLFLVPRVRPDGRINDFLIRRIKDKIGTRSLASTEADFTGALAYHLGPEQDGFRNMMRLVVNTSRLYISSACTGLARRAYVTATIFAHHRKAFGRTIVDYPLIQDTLANMRADVDAMTSASLHLAWIHDRAARSELSPDEQAFYRLALNLNKMRACKRARQTILSAMEVLGGNGAIETFSVLPRLLKDMLVVENWEGTYNTLISQIGRDIQKYEVHGGFFRTLNLMIGDDEHLRAALANSQASLAAVARAGELSTLALRDWTEHASALTWAAIRAWEECRATPSSSATASLEHLVERELVSAADRQKGKGYAARIKLLARP